MWDSKKIGLRQVGDTDPSSECNRAEITSPVILEEPAPRAEVGGDGAGGGGGGVSYNPAATL